MKIIDRYACAIRSSNLKVDPRTTYADCDVLGAMGIADRDLTRGHDSRGNHIHPAPLAVALERLFSGDNGASQSIVEILGQMAWQRAKAKNIKLKRVEADDMAKACLAWHRDGVCKPCGGHGYLIIRGSTTVGNQQCKACKGKRRIPFEKHFKGQLHSVAQWLIDEMDREQNRAGPAAMKKIASSMDF